MTRKTLIIFAVTHVLTGLGGFGLGIYLLPVLTAPPAPSNAEIAAQATAARYVGHFRRDLKDSDAFHWGEGKVTIGPTSVAFAGELASGPDYKLYFAPEFVETEADFRRLKSTMVRVGEVRTFKNFMVTLPAGFEPARYNTVIVWCETFSQFITAARYQ